MSASPSPQPSSPGGRPTRQRLDDLEALLQRMLDLPVNKAGDGAAAEGSGLSERPVLALVRPSISSSAVPEQTSPPVPAEAGPTAEERPTAQPAQPSPRMLSLSDLEQAAAPPLPAATEPTPTDEPGTPEEWVPFSSNWRPSSQTWAPLRESWQKSQGPEPARRRAPAAAAAAVPTSTAPTGTAPPEPSPSDPSPARVQLPATLQAPPAPIQEATTLEPPDAEPLPALGRAMDLPPLPLWAWPFAGLDALFDLAVRPLGAPGRWLRHKRVKDVLGVMGLLALAAAAGLFVADWYGWTW